MGQICFADERLPAKENIRTELKGQKSTALFNNLAFNASLATEILEFQTGTQKQLQQLKNFMPENENDQIPEVFRQKYVQQLQYIREKLIQQMKLHIDKYDGNCSNNEKIIEISFDGKYPLLTRSLIEMNSFENPQGGNNYNTASFEELTTLTECDDGQNLNQQMNTTVSYLYKLGYSESRQLSLISSDSPIVKLNIGSFDSSDSDTIFIKAYFIIKKEIN